MLSLLSLSPPSLSLSKPLLLRSLSSSTTMAINLKFHAFAGNPIRPRTPKTLDPLSPSQALESLKARLAGGREDSPEFRVLPFRRGRPLAGSDGGACRLGWVGLEGFREFCGGGSGGLSSEALVYLGSESGDGSGGGVVYWAAEATGDEAALAGGKATFVELRTLMVATDWDDDGAMGQLAIAGHARALLEWHSVSKFCGRCGERTVPMEAGRRKQCSSDACGLRVYPRVDPVVIMLVIDKENDRALFGRQSRFVPRMWSCLAGFMEPGESLEEAVRRETWEETGIEVGEVIYHSSQPWPVGPSSIPCQLMVGFFAYAKSLEINVDKSELEDAKWHSRDDVKKALMATEYAKAQKTAATKVEQMCKGVEKGQNLSGDFNVESGELASLFFPGPFAIAHHLISSWAFHDAQGPSQATLNQLNTSFSNL